MLDRKQHRKLDHLLRQLYAPESFCPAPREILREKGLDYLRHELRLRDNRRVYLSERGVETLRDINSIFRKAELVAATEPEDVANAINRVICGLLSEGQKPDDAHELTALVESTLEKMQQRYWFAVPVNGIGLSGVDRVALGGLTLVTPDKAALESFGAKPSSEDDLVKSLGRVPCLVGTVYGTDAFARREFRVRANLVLGIVAMVAAAMFSRGAVPFRLTLGMTSSGTPGVGKYARWHEGAQEITWFRGWAEHVPLTIDLRIAEYLQTDPYIQHALGLATRTDLSKLEQAILRGLFWFADAQQDTVTVMQLVKFWSCAEVIFSGDGKEITKTVSAGVAGAIVFGGFDFKRPDEYGDLYKRLTALYGKRSKAVHDARHDHVTVNDIAQLSRWSAQMLFGVIALAIDQHYTTTERVRVETLRLARVMGYHNARRPNAWTKLLTRVVNLFVKRTR